MLLYSSIFKYKPSFFVNIFIEVIIMDYHLRIQDLRIDADKTQQQIADILFCQREVYRRYEKGQREIPLWVAIKLAKYYNVSMDYFLGLTSKRQPFPKE